VSDVPEWVIFAITRVRPTFSSTTNAPKSGTATGFFLDCRGWWALVTNRHVVDHSLRSNSDRWTLTRLEVQARRASESGHEKEVEFIELDLERTKIALSPDADVAAVGMAFKDESALTFGDIDIDNLADEAFLRERARMMDLASLVGFPHSKNEGSWWDEAWNTPISRIASLASPPRRSFSNRSIATNDVGLVSGLSFAGSSGSPLFLHAKGQQNMSLNNAGYQEPKIVGIMSGHWWELDDEPGPDMFRHTGLSYYTRATAIRDVIQRLAAMRGV
jgi:Trypsin-like peptidase domain